MSAYFTDWRVKDNLIIATNILNKQKVLTINNNGKRNCSVRLYSVDSLYKFALCIMKKKNLDILDVTIYIKEEFKKGNYLGYVKEKH